ncbi:MAG: hypothetical protein HY698_17850 [Deltaproteobacteria bacterium]|nr:hypothetical protein [Deltaproteobacteria bacterium]
MIELAGGAGVEGLRLPIRRVQQDARACVDKRMVLGTDLQPVAAALASITG